ncbi:MAG: hypothetical protein EA404_04690 [Spirochaetaceae bacterium]|nr:MAG: hypothetical protein EA404_04690 [Spirochaetaceae bacterium]
MIPAPGAHNPAVRGLEIQDAASTLRPGAVVRARVVESLGDGRWRVSLNGRVLTARSSLALAPGQTFTTRVERTAGTLLLRLDSQSSVSEFLQTNNLPSDALTRAVVEALMRSGLPLEASQIRQLRAILSRDSPGSSAAERARLIALATAKKLQLSPEALDSLLQYGGDRGHGDRAPDQRGDQRRGGQQADSEEQIVRGAVKRSSPTAEHPAQLFNHAPGAPDDHWVIIPISYSADGVQHDASLRLCLSHDRRSTLRGALVVHAESRRWGFEWQMSDGRPAQLTLHPPQHYSADAVGSIARPIARQLEQLKAILRQFGVQSVDIGESSADFDGFSSDLPMDIMSSIQEDA